MLWSCLPREAAKVWKIHALLLLLCSDKNAQELCKITAPTTCRLEAKKSLSTAKDSCTFLSILHNIPHHGVYLASPPGSHCSLPCL